jgi:hypothetical protein
MIALMAAGLLGFCLALGFIWWLSRQAAVPLDPEQALLAAGELHRIRRRLDADVTKAELRLNARETERQALWELDREP